MTDDIQTNTHAITHDERFLDLQHCGSGSHLPRHHVCDRRQTDRCADRTYRISIRTERWAWRTVAARTHPKAFPTSDRPASLQPIPYVIIRFIT
jgi:hypothetical protein